MDKEDARRDMNIIINNVDNVLADASLFIEPLGDGAEQAFTDLTEALERFRAAVEKA